MAKFVYRTRTEAVHKRGEQRGADFIGIFKDEFSVFKPASGSNSIRILPPTDDAQDYFGMDVYVHYSVGPDNATVLCPSKMSAGQKRCPVCEARQAAERAGDEKLAKELRANRRVVVWLLDTRSNEDKGPQLWAMPWTCDRDIAKICRDPRTGDTYAIDHPDEGYDVYFDKEGEKERTAYTGHQLARRSSTVPDSALNYITEHPLPSVLVHRTYDEIKTLFQGGAEDGEPAPARRPVRGSRTVEDGEVPSRVVDDEPAPRRRVVDEEPAPRSRRTVEPADSDPPPRRTRPAPAADEEGHIPEEELEREALRAEPAPARTGRPRPAPVVDDEPPPPRTRRVVEEEERQPERTARSTLRDRYGAR